MTPSLYVSHIRVYHFEADAEHDLDASDCVEVTFGSLSPRAPAQRGGDVTLDFPVRPGKPFAFDKNACSPWLLAELQAFSKSDYVAFRAAVLAAVTAAWARRFEPRDESLDEPF